MPRRQAGSPQRFMRFGNAVLAKMENRGGQHGAGMAFGYAFNQMIEIAHTAAGDHRHIDSIGDGAG